MNQIVHTYLLQHDDLACAQPGAVQQASDGSTFAGDDESRMQGIELVKDRDTQEPAPDETASVFERSREHGLILSKSGTFKNVLRMVPPLCLSTDDVQPVLDALDRSFADVEKQR